MPFTIILARFHSPTPVNRILIPPSDRFSHGIRSYNDPAKPQNARPIGEWNDVEIIVYNGTVVHKQNGETVLEYHLWTPKWEEMIAGSKFPEYNENWHKVASKGYFGLQDHGEDVWFKDIKIKEL